MNTKYKVLIALTIIAVLGLIGFLVWWFKFSNTFYNRVKFITNIPIGYFKQPRSIPEKNNKLPPVIKLGGLLPIYSVEAIIRADYPKSIIEIYHSLPKPSSCIKLLADTYDNVSLFYVKDFLLTEKDRVIDLSYSDCMALGSAVRPTAFKRIGDCDLFNSKYDGYRLGDMVRVKNQRSLPKGMSFHMYNYPLSIASEYIRRTNRASDYKILADIVMERSNEISYDGTIALHLRVGDVVNSTANTVSEILAHRVYLSDNSWAYYTSCLKDISNGLAAFPDSNKIIIIAGSHMNENHSKSCAYLEAVQNYLHSLEYNVKTQIGGDPDQDFLLMCTAPYFISSGGGFSRNVVETRKILGNKPTMDIQELDKKYEVIRPGTCESFVESFRSKRVGALG